MKRILAIGLALLTTACADNKSMVVDYGATNTKEMQQIDPAVSFRALEQAPLCCDSLNQLNYQQINQPGKFDFNITQKNAAFNFSTGKSFVQGFTLPQANGTVKISISAPIVSSVFVPTVLILDEQYKPMQVYGEETIKYDSGSLLNVDRFFGKIELPAMFADGRQAKYLLVLTTEEAMKGTTKLAEPYAPAETLGRTDIVSRIHLDQPLPHTAVGVFRLAFDYLPNSHTSAQKMVEKTDSENSRQKAEALLVEQSVTAQAVSEAALSSSIQPETEAMFIELINQAVKNGESGKALRFVDEAELAGSNKARDALFEAMKKYQK
ncbi:MalM family protein [Psychromonas aquimarina]|uniref:MalM family protein n=1 Tax=Psychromonas aquimarina TaxID=444919 RepID=UPI0004082A16|nr:MalM family protein [Psychromonas aquimarina]